MVRFFEFVVILLAFCACRTPDKVVENPEGSSVERAEIPDEIAKQTVGQSSSGKKPSFSSMALYSRLGELARQWEIVEILSEDFNDGTFKDSGICSGNCPEVVRKNTSGDHFLRASLNGSMKVPYRTEISFVKGADLFMKEQTYLLVFKYRILQDNGLFPMAMFAQIHARNGKEEDSLGEGFWQPFVGRLRKDKRGRLWQSERSGGRNTKESFKVEFDAWQTCMVLLRLRSDQSGRIEVYRDGMLEFAQEGKNCGQWKYPLFLKLGLYTGKQNQYPPKNTERTVDYDDVLIYDISEATKANSDFNHLIERLE